MLRVAPPVALNTRISQLSELGLQIRSEYAIVPGNRRSTAVLADGTTAAATSRARYTNRRTWRHHPARESKRQTCIGRAANLRRRSSSRVFKQTTCMTPPGRSACTGQRPLWAPCCSAPLRSPFSLAPAAFADVPAFALGTASYAADQLVSRDAVTRAKLLRALKLNRVGKRPIGFVGYLGESGPPKHFNDFLLRDQHGNQHLPFGRSDQVILSRLRRGSMALAPMLTLGARVSARP